MSDMGPSIGLKDYEWSSSELLKGLCLDQISVPRSLVENQRSTLWHLMTLELESISFLRHLLSQRNASLSDEFVESSYLRYLDKQNHYRGLKRIASVLFDTPEYNIDLQVRRSCCEPLRSISLPADEFALLLSVALDKATKLHASNENITRVDALGVKSLSAWIRLVIRDNTVHYGNAIDILRRRHADRLQEASLWLEHLANGGQADDIALARLFFHDSDIYPDSLLHDSRKALLDILTA